MFAEETASAILDTLKSNIGTLWLFTNPKISDMYIRMVLHLKQGFIKGPICDWHIV